MQDNPERPVDLWFAAAGGRTDLDPETELLSVKDSQGNMCVALFTSEVLLDAYIAANSIFSTEPGSLQTMSDVDDFEKNLLETSGVTRIALDPIAPDKRACILLFSELRQWLVNRLNPGVYPHPPKSLE